MIRLLVTLLFFVFLEGSASAFVCWEDISKARHWMFMGPEVYHVKRIREGGTRQSGWMYGVRGSYDRIRRYKWYWGFDAAYAQGILRGHSGTGENLKSRFSDAVVEGRFGYTLQSKSASCASLTPFIGLGYFVERNHYIHPSPLKVHFRNSFYYFAFGAQSKAYITPTLSIGANVTGKYSLDGHVDVTRDSDRKIVLHYEHEFQCRVAIPLIYSFCCKGYETSLCLNPFYEFRHFGGHDRVPFNFLDTRLKVFGVDLFYVYSF